MKKKSKVKNLAELHHPHQVRPETFVIEIATPETGVVKRHGERPASRMWQAVET